MAQLVCPECGETAKQARGETVWCTGTFGYEHERLEMVPKVTG